MRFGYPAQARDQRPRASEAPASRRQPGGAAARTRLQHRPMHDAARPPRFALVPDLPAPARACRTKTFELCVGGLHGCLLPRRAAARSSARIRRAGCRIADAQQLQTLPAVADYDRGRESAEAEWAWEHWQGTLRAGAMRSSRASPTRATAGCWTSSPIVRSDGVVRVGYVTRVAHGRRRAARRGRTARPDAAHVVRQRRWR